MSIDITTFNNISRKHTVTCLPHCFSWSSIHEIGILLCRKRNFTKRRNVISGMQEFFLP